MSYARSAVTRMTLDISRPDLQRSETVTLGDTNRRWEVTLTNGGAPFRLPPNWTAALTGIKPDGTGILNGCSVADGKIVYDFAAGAEIATCAGSYPVQFDIWDEVGELVASPKVYVNVLADVRPHAELESNGQYTLIGDAIKKITDMEKDVDLLGDTALAQGDDIAALKKKVTTAGSVTIPASEWTDTLPKLAFPEQPVLAKGTVALLMPSDTDSQNAARKAKITVQSATYGGGKIVIQREDGEAPTGNITLDYIIIKVDNPEAPPKAALIGVDAYGEGGGTASGVDEEAVKAIITAMLGNVDNVKQYSAKNPPPYPVTKVNGQTGEVNLSIPSEAADVKADPAGTAESKTADLRDEVNGKLADYDKSTAVNKKIGDHNVSTESHADLRLELQRLADRLNAALNSDDTSLDDLKEIVAYIKSNKTLIDGVTASKVNVTDIVNNLTTNTANVPLSAAQGVALKLLIDSLEEIVEGKVTAEQVANTITAALKDYLTRNELNGAINTALSEAKESGEFDGESVTVSKVTESEESGGENVLEFSNGKKLTVRNGWDGRDGRDGKDGKTPVNGVDFLTPTEISNIKNEIGAELSQIPTPAIVSSVDEMTDTTKHYVLRSSGHIYASRTIQTGGDVIRTPNFTNLFNKASVTLNAYIGGTDDVAEDGSFVTDIMPFDIKTLVVPQTIRIANWYGDIGYHKRNKIAWYPGGAFNINCVDQLNSPAYVLVDSSNLDLQTITCQAGKIPNTNTATTSKITGFKLSFRAGSSAITLNDIPDDMIITVNEEITYTETTTPIETTTEWYDTGISYSPTFKTDLVGVMGENNVIYLSNNLPSGTYTLVDPDNNNATVGTITI